MIVSSLKYENVMIQSKNKAIIIIKYQTYKTEQTTVLMRHKVLIYVPF